jgi:hypothetical protein
VRVVGWAAVSYSFSAPAATRGSLKSDLAAAGEAAVTSATDATVAVTDHVDKIREAVEILASAVGRDVDGVAVHVNGHANPDHAPREGWADEMITVSIRALPPNE